MAIYNAGPYVEAAILSLLTQTYPHFELLLSDDNSTDGSSEICQRFAAKDPRIKYIKHTQNIGHIDNFNFVLEQAHGDYFMWAGHDDLWDPEYIATCLDHFTPELTGIFPRVSRIDEVGNTVFVFAKYPVFSSAFIPRVFQVMSAYIWCDKMLFYSGLFRLADIQKDIRLRYIGGQTLGTEHLILMELFSAYSFKIIPDILWFNRFVIKPLGYYEGEANRDKANAFHQSKLYYALKAVRKSLGWIGIWLRAGYCEWGHIWRKLEITGLFIRGYLQKRRLISCFVFIVSLPLIFVLWVLCVVVPAFFERVRPGSVYHHLKSQ